LKVGPAHPALAILSGVLLILSFPKFDLNLLAWIALVPLLVALEGKSLKAAYGLSYLAGLTFFAGITYWIWSVTAYNLLDEILLGIYLPQYVTLWGLGLNWIRQRTRLSPALIAPPLWVTMEYIRSHLSFLSLPWMLVGHSQYLHPPLVQISSLTGVYGLSFLIVLVNVAIAETILYVRSRLSEPATSLEFRRSPLTSLLAAGLLLTITALYGLFVLSEGIGGERVRVALVQGNVPQARLWDGSYRQTIFDRYARLTQNAARREPTLIVWPETAVPGDVQHHPVLRRTIAQVAIETNRHLLLGSSEYAKFTSRKMEGSQYNSMFLFTPEGKIEGQYRKIALIPFGEYEPLRGTVRWPTAIASTMGTSLPGDQHTLFSIGAVTFGSVICWETIFPDLFREFVKGGARFMVNATNEAWFPSAGLSYQLLAMTTFRAAENRVAIARAANTGISAFIDPFGRITERLRGPDQQELFVEGVLVGDIPLSQGKTFYTQHGDVFAFLLMAISVLMLFSSVVTVRTERPAEE